jgi:hypothetical protein
MLFFGRIRGYNLGVKSLLILFIFFITGPAHSTIDMNVFGFYRTKPIAGGLDANVGYNQLLWGDKGAKPLYGFVRPNVTFFTAGQYNAYTVEAEFWPISFLGVEAGKEKYWNNGIYQDYDCETFQCQKEFSNTYLKYNVLLGYSMFFFKGVMRQQTVKAAEADRDFIYPQVGSALNAGEDEVKSRELTFGLNFGFYKVIYQDIKADIEVRKNKHRMRTFIVALNTQPLKTYISYGRFISHQIDSNFIAVALNLRFGETLKLD